MASGTERRDEASAQRPGLGRRDVICPFCLIAPPPAPPSACVLPASPIGRKCDAYSSNSVPTWKKSAPGPPSRALLQLLDTAGDRAPRHASVALEYGQPEAASPRETTLGRPNPNACVGYAPATKIKPRRARFSELGQGDERCRRRLRLGLIPHDGQARAPVRAVSRVASLHPCYY